MLWFLGFASQRSKAKQSKLKQSKANQSKAKQSKARQSKAKQSKAKTIFADFALLRLGGLAAPWARNGAGEARGTRPGRLP